MVLANDYDSNYKLSFIEAKPMQQVVTAGQLADSINRQGFATLYINFDNNRSEIRSEARPALDEVVALLKNTPGCACPSRAIRTTSATHPPTRRCPSPGRAA